MRILVVAPYVPYEGIPHAGGAYLLRHLEALAADHEVTLFVPEHERLLPDGVTPPAGMRIVRGVPGARGAWRQQWDRARRVVRFRSLRASTLRGFHAHGIVEEARRSDVVELQWLDSTIVLGPLRRAGVRTPVSVVAHDVDLEASRSLLAAVGTRRQRLAARLLAPIRRAMLRRDLRMADVVYVFKAADEVLLRGGGVRAPVEVLAPNIEGALGPGAPRPASVLFTGAMWRPENDHGVRWFLDAVWPRVAAAVPEATFVVAGARPSSEVRAWDGRDGVVVTGEVASLGPHYRGASAFVAPLFVAGGLKFKVAEAMASGLPVVATTVAAAGIVDATPPGPLWAVTDDAEEMARTLVDLLERPEAGAALGRDAARWVQEQLSFSASMGRVAARYGRLASGR
jgi:glycosyltransferase involved in cell wall biosynthesis